MKNSLAKNKFPNNTTAASDSEEISKKEFYSPKAVKSIMTEQLTIPPARVWDKIELMLDEQDNRRRRANKMIAASFKSKERRSQVYLFALGGASLIAGLFWFIK